MKNDLSFSPSESKSLRRSRLLGPALAAPFQNHKSDVLRVVNRADEDKHRFGVTSVTGEVGPS